MRAEHMLDHTIAGYRLLEILGRGGMGIVFLGQRLDNPQEQAAIKILLPSDFSTASESAAFQARFLREIQAVRQLQHEHILPILESGEDEDGIFYMVMPLILGGTLAQKFASTTGLLPLPEIASYLNQLASAIDYSNEQGMVHRDIKPSNVLLDEQGKIYLADFGIVRLFDSGHLALDEVPTTLTSTGQIYGTPAYMAPERFQGEPAEPATDRYALGILLYQFVTGQLPFDADNPLALAMKHLKEEPLSPRSLRPDLPEPAEVALLKALDKRPAERFSTATALATAFSTGLNGEWVEELLPLAAILAVSSRATLVQQPVVVSAAPMADILLPDQFFRASALQTANNDHALASAPTAKDAVVVARTEPRSWKTLQIFALSILGVVLLFAGGVLALAAYRSGTAVPTPAIHHLSTSTSVPTRTKGTAIPAAPSVGTQPTQGVPALSPTSGVTPVPTTPPVETPTPGDTPVVTPTVGETPST